MARNLSILIALATIATVPMTARAAAPAATSTAPANLLTNAGLEQFNDQTALPAAFTMTVYGAAPTVRADRDVFKEGRQSLRVTATAPSDTALAQDITVRPGAAYRFSGSVRTADLTPEERSWTHGTFQIQDSAGHVLASLPNHRGTTDWTRETVAFRAPPDGKLHVVCFFVGYGQGTGTAWFDDLRLEPVHGADVLVITPQKLQNEPISPLIYGNFVELLSDLIPSMWSEMLDTSSFEYLLTPEQRELHRPLVIQDPTRDPRDRPWRPWGDPEFAAATLDTDHPFNGAASQRVELRPGGADAGIWQDDIAVEAHAAYRFVGHFRAKDFSGPLTVEVRLDDAVLASASIDNLSETWQRKEILLTAAQTAPHARFVIRFSAPGTLWIDRLSLMPVKNVSGWRPDVVNAIKAMKPGLLRWGGSIIEVYDWKTTVGPWENRVPFPNRVWGRVDPNLVGIDEFIAFCHAVDAEPMICLRWSGQKPSDAVDLLQYCNAGPDTPMGAWRARNGHPQPYHVKYWQIGNEVSGPEYNASVADFAKALKQADPGIHLLASFITEGLVNDAGPFVEYLGPHPYNIGDLAGTAAEFARYAALLDRLDPQHHLRLGLTEWNTTAGDFGNPQRPRMMTLANALAGARFLHLCHRHSALIKIACRSNISNSYGSGIIQTNARTWLGTPAYYMSMLYARHAGSWPLTLGCPPELLPVDASATLSHDGRTLTLLLVNPQPQAIVQSIDASALGSIRQEARVWTLVDTADAGDPDAMNTFDRPDRIRIIPTTFHRAAPHFEYRLPALSVVALELTLQPRP